MIDAVSEREKDVIRSRAVMLSAIYNANGNTKQGTDHGFIPEDFLPDELKPAPKKLTMEEYWDAMLAANVAMGGMVEII